MDIDKLEQEGMGSLWCHTCLNKGPGLGLHGLIRSTTQGYSGPIYSNPDPHGITNIFRLWCINIEKIFSYFNIPVTLVNFCLSFRHTYFFLPREKVYFRNFSVLKAEDYSKMFCPYNRQISMLRFIALQRVRAHEKVEHSQRRENGIHVYIGIEVV